MATSNPDVCITRVCLRRRVIQGLLPEIFSDTRHPIPGLNAFGYGYLVGALHTRLDRRVIGYTRLPTRPLRYRAEDT
eukprot:scaffold27581_cov70-Cyclotella_meneghiniana.AAC.1